jgi:hypothetical protein
MVEGPRPSQTPTVCLVKPAAAWTDFLGSKWDSPTGATLALTVHGTDASGQTTSHSDQFVFVRR